MKEYRSTKEVARLVREQLKKELPLWKFSVTYESFSGGSRIDLRLMSGPLPVIAEGPQHGQLNPYAFSGLGIRNGNWNNGVNLTQEGWDVMEEVNWMVSSYHWDESEPQADYFNCNFYYDLTIGSWDKDYQLKGDGNV